MKQFFLTIFLLLFFIINSQNRFQEGYLILNSNQKISCLIKNTDWRNNPKSFRCKVKGEDKKYDINEIKEFSIPKIFKYIRFEGLVDVSANDVAHLTEGKEPVWVNKIVFLEVMVEGNIELYRYKNDGILRFFHKPEGGQIEQLIYKRFVFNPKIEDNSGVSAQKLSVNKILSNNTYKSQLIKNYTRSEDIDFNIMIQKLKYKTKPMIKLFLHINNRLL